MKVNITKKEYRILLHMLYLGDWVLNSCVPGERADTKDYRDLFERLLALAPGFSCEDLVSERSDGRYDPSAELEEHELIRGAIDEYDNETFWSELAERLANRDLIREVKEEAYAKMAPEERMQLFFSYETKYQKEFERFGINRLLISGHAPSGKLG
jgi:hypothetical protein